MILVSINHSQNKQNIDEFIDVILTSKKFAKLVDVIAEKTIVKLWNMKNNKMSNDQNQTDGKLRRHINAIDEHSLRNITLKYRELINQLNGEKLVFKASSKELKYYESNEVNTTPGYIKDNATNSNVSKFEISKSQEKIFKKKSKNDNISSKLSKLSNSKENPGEKLQKQFRDNFLNINKQKDLNRKNTGRKEGDKIFVFQSSSDYDEYHEKVETILNNEES